MDPDFHFTVFIAGGLVDVLQENEQGNGPKLRLYVARVR